MRRRQEPATKAVATTIGPCRLVKTKLMLDNPATEAVSDNKIWSCASGQVLHKCSTRDDPMILDRASTTLQDVVVVTTLY